ncbi:MAG: DUF493 family protein [Spirochaetota bacterium]
MASISDNQQPHFPARTVMKIITEMPRSVRVQEMRLEEVFYKLMLKPKPWSEKSSGKQKYMSFTTEVYIQNREQLHSLYTNLQQLPEVKQVL